MWVDRSQPVERRKEARGLQGELSRHEFSQVELAETDYARGGWRHYFSMHFESEFALGRAN